MKKPANSNMVNGNVNSSANSNMYSYAVGAVAEVYESWLVMPGSGLVCVVSLQPLGQAECSALGKSFARLGYGDNACAFASLSEGPQEEGVILDAGALFTLIEGIDPCVLIVTDAHAARTVADAYRTDISLDELSRVFGRSCLAFRSFSALLETPEGKQRAWALLKKFAARSF